MTIRGVVRRALVWLYSGVSLLGFVAEPTQANLFAIAGYVVVVTGLTAFLHWVFTDRTMGADPLLTVALGAAGLPMALSAIFTLPGPAGLAIGLILVALGVIATIEQVATYLTAGTSEPGEAAAALAGARRTPEGPTLEAMSTTSLTTTWESCGSGLDGVQLRADILDELERRDPAGVGRWIRDGVAASPADYVRDT